MSLYKAMIILKAHKEWLFDKRNMPKTADEKVIEAIKTIELEIKRINKNEK